MHVFRPRYQHRPKRWVPTAPAGEGGGGGGALPWIRRTWVTKPPPGTQINWGHPLARDLIGAWLLNEGGGQKVTDSCHNAHGTFATTDSGNDPTWRVGGDSGKAIDLAPPASTTGPYIDLGTTTPPKFQFGSAVQQPLTIAVSINPQAANQQSNWGYVFANNDGSTGAEFGMSCTSADPPFFNVRYGGSSYTSAQDPAGRIPEGVWSQCVHTVGPVFNVTETIKMFINGIKVDFFLSNTSLDNGNGLAIGRNPGQTNRYFGGGIDYVFMWKRAFTESEVWQLYVDPFQFFVQPRSWIGSPPAAAPASSIPVLMHSYRQRRLGR